MGLKSNIQRTISSCRHAHYNLTANLYMTDFLHIYTTAFPGGFHFPTLHDRPPISAYFYRVLPARRLSDEQRVSKMRPLLRDFCIVHRLVINCWKRFVVSACSRCGRTRPLGPSFVRFCPSSSLSFSPRSSAACMMGGGGGG